MLPPKVGRDPLRYEGTPEDMKGPPKIWEPLRYKGTP